MIDPAEAVRSIYGVWRLAHLDRKGMAFIDGTPGGAIRSFWAAVLVLPAFVVLELLQYGSSLGQLPLLRWLILEALFYVIAWTAFPVILHLAAQSLNRSHRYCAALSAYNWSSVIQVGVFLPVAIGSALGLWPEGLAIMLSMVVFVLLLIYLGFVLSVALEVSRGTAAALVGVELFVTLVLSESINRAVGSYPVG